ncbi:hypothetical protein EER27_05785 [Lysobacter psychrotolerans]|uniref:Uncharacterized protein n=1 Tax=Montanilutibacter psychrotolerans TaxID=1327343 RepID=A0A3M8T1A3_9GAMM|nr:hypothetical protein EER27_05785 [Lysobacter psychrotolerans]
MGKSGKDEDAIRVSDNPVDILSENGVKGAVSILKQELAYPFAAINAKQASAEGVQRVVRDHNLGRLRGRARLNRAAAQSQYDHQQ